MKFVGLGKSDLRVSCVGYGALQASGSDFDRTIREREIISAIERAYEAGVTFIDTAEIYGEGHSELVVGKAIKRIGRDNLVIATKVHGTHLRSGDLEKACEASLKRLGIPEIDLYQVHWPDPWEQIPFKETFRALEKLYKRGVVRAIGVCNFAVRDLKEAQEVLSRTEIASNQVRYNILQREIAQEVLPYCHKNSISVIAWSPLAQGALTGKYGVNKAPRDNWRSDYPLFARKNLAQIRSLLGVLKQISARRRKTIAQVSLNWLISKKTVPIPGARNDLQAEENAGAADWSLANDEIKRIDRIAAGISLSYFQ